MSTIVDHLGIDMAHYCLSIVCIIVVLLSFASHFIKYTLLGRLHKGLVNRGLQRIAFC